MATVPHSPDRAAGGSGQEPELITCDPGTGGIAALTQKTLALKEDFSSGTSKMKIDIHSHILPKEWPDLKKVIRV